jgi:hypothetical protein
MDALDLLEQQQRDVSGLLGQIAVERRAGSRSALVVRMVRLLEASSRIKEKLFYPLCGERMRESRAPLYEAYESLALTRFAAGNLLRTRATDVRFDARLKLVDQLFTRVAAQEEDWMFPKAKRERTDEELDALGDRLGRAFEVLMTVESLGARPVALRDGRAVPPSSRRRSRGSAGATSGPGSAPRGRLHGPGVPRQAGRY